jgi:hypothetical protein
MPATDFDDLVDMYHRYLSLVEPAAVGESRRRLTSWARDGVPQLRVRVVLPGGLGSPAGQ